MPIKFLESAHAHSHALESGDADIKFTWQNSLFNDVFAELFFGDQIDHLDLRVPPGELLQPVSDNGLGHDNQVVALVLFELSQEAQQRNSLDGLSEAHLVCQNAIDACLVQGDHPVEPIQLVVPQLEGALQRGGLGSQSGQHGLLFVRTLTVFLGTFLVSSFR